MACKQGGATPFAAPVMWFFNIYFQLPAQGVQWDNAEELFEGLKRVFVYSGGADSQALRVSMKTI